MKRKIVAGILFIASLAAPTLSLAESIQLKKCQVFQEDNQLNIRFEFDGRITYHCMLLNEPDRFVVDFKHVLLKTSLPPQHNLLVKNLRSSEHEHDYLRLVFDLKQKVNFTTQADSSHEQVTIHLFTSNQETQAAASKQLKTSSKKLAEKPRNKETEKELDKEVKREEDQTLSPIKLSKTLLSPESNDSIQRHKGKNIVIVIDPGHGGKDPGAAGPQGNVEKDVVLKISKQLQAMLNEEPGFCALLTRCTDCYLPLRKRLSIARKNHADMFIAIHADAYHHSHATGASVYALSQRGATSEAARWLAEKENESELGGLSNELADKDALLRSVLIDLSQTHTIESSLLIGNNVLRNLGKHTRLHHARVEQAAFVVLKSPDIPSILVETGFLSNPFEEEKLTDFAYQHQTAYAIKEGIKHYFTTNSPGGTWFADHREKSDDLAAMEASKTETATKKNRKTKRVG